MTSDAIRTPAYAALRTTFHRVAALNDAAGVLGWDAQAMMPAGAAAGRAEQLATVRGLAHDLLVDDRVADLLNEAEDNAVALDAWDRANLREMRRTYRHAAAVPSDIVVAESKATSDAEMVWRGSRATSDFALLRPHLEAVLALQREIGSCKGAALGLHRYDALLDTYEPGLRRATIDPLFGRLRDELPALIAEARVRQEAEDVPVAFAGRYAVASQRDLGQALMARLGFDFERGRLDTSLHPFCGGATNDVRITTRYREDDFTRALMGVLHETGHALYEQGRPHAWLHQPVGQARGMALHESQSLLIEMQACRSRPFMTFLAPLLREHFARDEAAFDPDALYRHFTRVEPGLIRVDADEVTYPAHIILRLDLESAMIAGDLAVADLPDAFNKGMADLLGVTVPDDARGCLQDIHWPSGAWGYFPTYTLGAIAAAQLFAAACDARPELRDGLARGEFGPLVEWLRDAVHTKGSLLETDDLMRGATGQGLSVEPYLAHLRRRYGSLASMAG